MKKRLTRLTLLTVAAVAAFACNDRTSATDPKRPPVPSGVGSMASMSCAASFRMIAVDSDSLMAPYGLPSVVDTVDVCEAWTGSDYTYQATLAGSADNIPNYPDTMPTVTYDAGYLVGYDAANNVSSEASSASGTSFDFLVADASTKAASFDYPYYALSSPDPTPSSCIQPPCPVMMRSALPSSVAATQSSVSSDHHGLSRRGFRALVDSAVELSPSSNG